MYSVAAPIWNRIAPLAASPAWARMFSLNAAEQERAMRRLADHLATRGVHDGVVRDLYLRFAPLLAESEAIGRFGMAHPEYRGALPEICSFQEAIWYACGDQPLTSAQLRQFRAALEWPIPRSVYRPRPASEQVQQCWTDEARRISFAAVDAEVADAAQLPASCWEAKEWASIDKQFEVRLAERMDFVLARPLLCLAIEQCSRHGELSPAVWREARLASAAESVGVALQSLIDNCERSVLTYVVHRVHWMVRSERSRRTGCPDWSASRAARRGDRLATAAVREPEAAAAPRKPAPTAPETAPVQDAGLDALSDDYLASRLRRGLAGPHAQGFRSELQRRGIELPPEPSEDSEPAVPVGDGRLTSLVQLTALPLIGLVLGYFLPQPFGDTLGRTSMILLGVAFVYWVVRFAKR